jgi:hypothetical protein
MNSPPVPNEKTMKAAKKQSAKFNVIRLIEC